jgi:hypothetical protein
VPPESQEGTHSAGSVQARVPPAAARMAALPQFGQEVARGGVVVGKQDESGRAKLSRHRQFARSTGSCGRISSFRSRPRPCCVATPTSVPCGLSSRNRACRACRSSCTRNRRSRGPATASSPAPFLPSRGRDRKTPRRRRQARAGQARAGGQLLDPRVDFVLAPLVELRDIRALQHVGRPMADARADALLEFAPAILTETTGLFAEADVIELNAVHGIFHHLGDRRLDKGAVRRHRRTQPREARLQDRMAVRPAHHAVGGDQVGVGTPAGPCT